MADEIKNVFISHVHEDDDGLAKLKNLLKGGGLTIRDSSINSSNPNDAKVLCNTNNRGIQAKVGVNGIGGRPG